MVWKQESSNEHLNCLQEDMLHYYNKLSNSLMKRKQTNRQAKPREVIYDYLPCLKDLDLLGVYAVFNIILVISRQQFTYSWSLYYY